MSNLISKTFHAGKGIFKMVPNFVPVTFGIPGHRLKLHPDDYLSYGADSGMIMERWICSINRSRASNPRRPEQGASFVSAENGEMFLFRDAIHELKEELIGRKLNDQYGTFPVFSKFFDYETPLYFHFHPRTKIARNVGCEAKPECYYFPPQLNNYSGKRPSTYFGFNQNVTREEVRWCIENFDKCDTHITRLSKAYDIAPGQGWYVPAGIIHAPGSLLTYEPQWSTDLNCVLENVVCGEVFSKQYLTDIVPDGISDITDYIMEAIDWEANYEADFKEKYFRPSIELPVSQNGLLEKWICYGNEYITAKEVTILPGHEIVLKDGAAYGCIIIQGYGTFGVYRAEAVNMMRVGNATADEYFVSKQAAELGVRIRNQSVTEPMVILQHFGPDRAVFPADHS